MALGVFDLFKVGIGPSSSHTVGPMWAAHRFLAAVEAKGGFEGVASARVALYGSLALTGKGHATDKAVVLGLMGHRPDQIEADRADADFARVVEAKRLSLMGLREIPFDPETAIAFHWREKLPAHSNGMRFVLEDESGQSLHEGVYYSVGGGFVLSEEEADQNHRPVEDNIAIPHPFESGADLLRIGDETGLSIAEIVLRNEDAFRDRAETEMGLYEIWAAMRGSIDRGCGLDGVLPGGLQVKRRAKKLFRDLRARDNDRDPFAAMDWVSLYALAVNEENAAGGRVVTAPTNGAAGVIPAVLAYWLDFGDGKRNDAVIPFLATSAAIGMLYKKNASISAAEVGCQGEVGVACSMAAGALAAVMGGTNRQIENAAEIGMEHNLGLTCDPIGGLVQIPCIERNTMGAVKAINAARLALNEDGEHLVSLDKVIATMRETGRDMHERYKETSQGGLAVAQVAC